MEYVGKIISRYEDYYCEVVENLKDLEIGTDEFEEKTKSLKTNIDKLLSKNEKIFSIIDALAVVTRILDNWDDDTIEHLQAIHENVKRLRELITDPTDNRMIDDECIKNLQNSFESIQRYYYVGKLTASYSMKACSSDVRDEYMEKLKSSLNLIKDVYKTALKMTLRYM